MDANFNESECCELLAQQPNLKRDDSTSSANSNLKWPQSDLTMDGSRPRDHKSQGSAKKRQAYDNQLNNLKSPENYNQNYDCSRPIYSIPDGIYYASSSTCTASHSSIEKLNNSSRTTMIGNNQKLPQNSLDNLERKESISSHQQSISYSSRLNGDYKSHRYGSE